jgi:hypothetical protein
VNRRTSKSKRPKKQRVWSKKYINSCFGRTRSWSSPSFFAFCGMSDDGQWPFFVVSLFRSLYLQIFQKQVDAMQHNGQWNAKTVAPWYASTLRGYSFRVPSWLYSLHLFTHFFSVDDWIDLVLIHNKLF